jgi:hypothetical protein
MSGGARAQRSRRGEQAETRGGRILRGRALALQHRRSPAAGWQSSADGRRFRRNCSGAPKQRRHASKEGQNATRPMAQRQTVQWAKTPG